MIRRHHEAPTRPAAACSALVLALLGGPTVLADDMRCPSVGGGAGQVLVADTHPQEASQFNVGHGLVGSVTNVIALAPRYPGQNGSLASRSSTFSLFCTMSG